MRILFLNSEAELYNNGADKILLLAVEALAADHDVRVLLPLDGPLVDAIRENGVPCEVRPYAIMRRSTAGPLAAVAYFVGLVVSTLRIRRYVRRHRFDAIYSNKVLQHLTRDQMRESLRRQLEVLRPGGVALHALWRGDEDEEHSGLLFTKYTEDSLSEVIPAGFEVVDVAVFKEMATDDSLRVHLRRGLR